MDVLYYLYMCQEHILDILWTVDSVFGIVSTIIDYWSLPASVCSYRQKLRTSYAVPCYVGVNPRLNSYGAVVDQRWVGMLNTHWRDERPRRLPSDGLLRAVIETIEGDATGRWHELTWSRRLVKVLWWRRDSDWVAKWIRRASCPSS